MLETEDIQHILLTRTPALTGRYEFLSFRDAAGGRAWLSAGNYPGGVGGEVGKRRSVRQVPRPCAARLRLILCRHGTRRSRTLEQGRTDRAGAAAAAPGEDLAHLFQASLPGPQGTPRAGPPRRGQAGARRP